MPKRDQQLINKRNKAILKRFDALSNIKRNGVKLYSYNYIINLLKTQFYLSERSIIDIIHKRLK